MQRHELIMPDLGLAQQPIVLSLWLVRRGSRVVEGDPVLEVSAGPAVVDLSAPAGGVLVEMLAAEDDPLAVGQRLGVIESAEDG